MSSAEGLHKHAFWLYGVIIGLAIKAALEIVVKHLISPPVGLPRDASTEAARLIVFLVLIIQFYLGSVVFYDKVYENPEDPEKFKGANYAVDFLFGLIHFLFFFGWSLTIDTHSGHLRLFPLGLAFILLYDFIWLIASLNYPTRNNIARWTFVNFGTVVLAIAIYYITLSVYNNDDRTAERIAYIPVILVSIVDIVGMITNREIIADLFRKLFSHQA